MHTCGEGRYRVWLEEARIGEDRVFLLGGGERPHVGCVTVCEPGKAPVSHELEGHYDKAITEPIAVRACEKYNVRAVCLGGVHIQDATKEEIAILVENCRRLADCI